VAIPMATPMPDFESMPLDELRTWSARQICEADPRVLRAHGTKDSFTEVLFIRITWKPDAHHAAHDPLLGVLQRTLARWAWKNWLVVVTDQPPEPPPRRRAPTTYRRP